MNQLSKEIQRIVYVTNDGLTDPLGQSQILPYLLKLQNPNREIHIVSAEKNENFQKDETIINALIIEKNIKWHPIKYLEFPPVLSRFLTYKNLLKKAKKLVLSDKTIVHGRSDIGSLVGLKLKRKYNCKLVFDMRGFWADERWDGNIWNRNNFIHRMLYKQFKNHEKTLYKESDAIVSLTHDGKNILMDEYGVEKEKITVIPCCTDRELFDPKQILPKEVQIIRSDLNINEGEKVICYLGSLGTWYLLKEMLEFFKVVLEEKSNVKFLFVTRDDPKKIFQAAEKLHIESNKILVRSANRNEVPMYISSADIGIFFIKPCYSKKASSPTKMGEFLSMGLPVIGNKGVGDVDHIIDKYQCGLVVNNLNHQDYQKVAQNIEKVLNSDSQHSLAAADAYFDLIEGVKSYEAIYSRLQS